jgi:hypothetical protein
VSKLNNIIRFGKTLFSFCILNKFLITICNLQIIYLFSLFRNKGTGKKMDGELLINFIPSSNNKIYKKDCLQKIIRKDGSDIGEWKRYVILPAKIKQKVSFYI